MSKIISITPYRYTPPENGGHQGIILVDKLMHMHNDVISLSTINNAETFPLEVGKAFILPDSKRRYMPYLCTSAIKRSARTFQADYIFLHHHYMFFSAFQAARAIRKPLYIRSHNIESERFKSLGKKWWPIMAQFEKYAYQKADKVFFVTEDDKDWAIRNYRVKPDRTEVMPFGIDFEYNPSLPATVKIKVGFEWGIKADVPWLFFMGKLDYPPNESAVKTILFDIIPLLRRSKTKFQFIIFGKNLNPGLEQHIKNTAHQHHDTHYLGFIPHLEEMLSACDIMVNPVMAGGGVKTKVVESLAWNKTVISTQSGAQGISPLYCGKKLILTPDSDWHEMTEMIRGEIGQSHSDIPPSFYDYYALKNIAARLQKHFL